MLPPLAWKETSKKEGKQKTAEGGFSLLWSLLSLYEAECEAGSEEAA